MTSANGKRDVAAASDPPPSLRRCLNKAFLTARTPGSVATALVTDVQAATDLTARIAEQFIALARADERQQCISFLRGEATCSRVAASVAPGPEAVLDLAEARKFEDAAQLLATRADGLETGVHAPPGEGT